MVATRSSSIASPVASRSSTTALTGTGEASPRNGSSITSWTRPRARLAIDMPGGIRPSKVSSRMRTIAGPGITIGSGSSCTREMSSDSSRWPAVWNATESVVLPNWPGAATSTAEPPISMAAACSDRSPRRVNASIAGTPHSCVSRRNVSISPSGTSIVPSKGAIRNQPVPSPQKVKMRPPPYSRPTTPSSVCQSRICG